MRISPPAGCEVTTHLLRRLSGQFEVSLALWHVFAITEAAQPVDDARVLWQLAKKHAPNQPLDEGFPKAKAEFLCFGAAYPPDDLRRGPFPVSVQVAQTRRELAVYGPRVLGVLGDPQEVTPPRDPVAVSPEQAFGGAGHLTNPEGLGYRGKTGDAAPRLEDPHSPMTAASEKLAPACFWPLSPASPQRRSHLGTFDQAWLERDWPNFAPDTDMDYFQMAPAAQQIGVLRGDEQVQIVGMNPTRQALQFQLPGQRARCVVRRARSSANIFEGWGELPLLPETLCLFPNEGIGALLHRGVMTVERADALDLMEILLQLEPLTLNTLPTDIMMQLYRARWLQPTEPPSSPAAGGVTASSAASGSQAPVQAATVAKRVTRAGTVKLWPEMEYVLSQPGMAADVAQTIRESEDPVDALATELKRQLRQALSTYEAALRDDGMSEASFLQALSETPQFKGVLGKDTTVKSLSLELEKLTDFVDTLVANLRRSMPDQAGIESNQVTPSDADLVEPPDEQTLAQIRAFIASQTSQPTGFRGMNLSGLYLVGLDLAGMDFTDVICEETHFDQCNLTGARFNRAILTGAHFTGAQMASVDCSDASCQHAVFDQAVLKAANLTNADLTDTSCRGALFDGALLHKTKLNQADLTQASFCGVRAMGASFNESLIDHGGFSQAELERVDFLKAKLVACDFQQVNSDRLDFSGATLKDCQFVDATLRASSAMLSATLCRCHFERADLGASNWSTAVIEETLFLACHMAKLDLSSSRLHNARVSRCQAPAMSLFSAAIENVQWLQSNLMQASFHGADLKSSSMMGNNLYGADFTECKFDDQIAFEGNVTLRTRLSHKGHPNG